MTKTRPPNPERGFVLVTSLIFLVVITLLAVSAMNSATLQERMASNQRDKSQARQASDATLRQAEMLLGQSVFNTYQVPGKTYGTADSNKPYTAGVLRLWKQDSMFSTVRPDDSLGFLETATWTDGVGYSSYTASPSMPDTRFYVEEAKDKFQARDLNPDTRASADGGVVYRITARSQGKNPAAISVTQSFYEKRY